MSPSQKLLNELLEDAKLVASYALRTGRLRDSSLPRAIAATEALKERTWGDQAVVQLQTALNAAMRAIAPTTLIDLRTADPFAPRPKPQDADPRPWWRRLNPNYVFVFFSLVMMVTAGWYTLQYNIGASATVELERIGEEGIKEEIGLIVRQILVAEPKLQEAADSGNAIDEGEQYLVLVEKLKEYDGRVKKYSAIATSFMIDSHNPLMIAYIKVGPPVVETIKQWLGQNDLPYGPCSIADPVAKPPDQGTVVAALKVADPPVAKSAAKVDAITNSQPPFDAVYNQYVNDALHLLCVAGVQTTPFNIPPIAELALAARNRINLLSLWFLPAIYGGLGATIYYMRRILDPTLVDPSWHRILHRIALGAFAGVIIAWFWSPSSRIYNDFVDVGLNLFGAAFIIGFSVDIFFAFLDRVVVLTVNWIKQLGVKPVEPTNPDQ